MIKENCLSCDQNLSRKSKSKICKKCLIKNIKNTTLGELKAKHKNRKTKCWYSSEIRNFARTWNPQLLSNPCQVCNYKNHTELCHIKPIGNCEDSMSLGEINSPSNLIVLCPNHHWEFDNGILKLEHIPVR